MKNLFLSALVLVLTACSSGSDNNKTPNNTPDIPSIVGTWYTLDDATQCKTTLTFNDDGSYSGKSLDNLTTGIYETSDTHITLKGITDNTLPNCDGESTDDTGETLTRAYTVTETRLIFLEDENYYEVILNKE